MISTFTSSPGYAYTLSTSQAIDLSSGITTGAAVVVVIGNDTVVEVVVVFEPSLVEEVVDVVLSFVTDEDVVKVVTVVDVVPPIVIEPSTSFTLDEILTPFSALTTVSAHLTGYVPVVPAGISNVSVAITSPSLAVAPFTVAKR